jgi:hypothetical protein
MKLKLAVIASALGLLAGLPLAAHHSFAGTYLEDAEPIKISGTLKQFLVRNPHSFVHVEDEKLKDKDGKPVRWSIEWGAAGQLAQQGVTNGTLKVGDKVVVTGSPGRNPSDYRLRLRTIVRPKDGWSYGTNGQTFN